MFVFSINGKKPSFGHNCFIAPNATITGDVEAGENCTFWFNSVVRGDVNSILIGNNTNIQDGAVIHCTYKKAATTIGNNVSIGHNAIVHGCNIHDNVLIGMGAIVMDNAVVAKNCIIAAGAVVLGNTICQEGFLYAGVPAKKIKPISQDQIDQMTQTARNYILYASWLKDQIT